MSWPHAEEVWLSDEKPMDSKTAKRITDHTFWHYVDSQPNAYSHPGECWEHETIPGARVWLNNFGTEPRQQFCRDFTHIRGDAVYCMAAKSSLDECGKHGVMGLPFCAFHFDNVWKYMKAAVFMEREEQAHLDANFEYQIELKRVGIDAAAVRDAQAALARQPERVYFFLADHAVKVGRSIHPEHRVKTLKGTKAPEGIDTRAGRLLGTIPGGSKTEGALHLEFRPFLLVGEWFEYAPIADQIAALIAERSEAAA